MLLLDYLERATASIHDNAKARRIREEMLAHLMALKDEALGNGAGEGEALEFAMRHFGDPEELSRELGASTAASPPLQGRRTVRIGLLAVAAACATMSFIVWPFLFGMLLATALAGIVSLGPRSRPLWETLRLTLGRLLGPLVLAALLGAAVGAEPLLAAGALDPLHLPAGVLVAYPVLTLALGAGTLYRIGRRPADILPLACVSAGAVFAVSLAVGLVLWHVFPWPPSPGVDWFVSPYTSSLGWQTGLFGVLPPWGYPVSSLPAIASHPIWAAAAVFLAVTFFGAISRGIAAMASPDLPSARLG